MARHPLPSNPSLRAACGLATALLLGGCISTTGDFGRPQPGFTNDVLLPFTGMLAAKARGEPSSSYALTEDEKVLRNRAWNFLMPENDAPRGTWMEHNLAFHRILPPRSQDVTLYHRTIMGGPQFGGGRGLGDSPNLRAITSPGGNFRSLTSRYNRVRDSIAADHALIPYFKLVASQVRQADHIRLQSLGHVRYLTEEHRAEAIARVCENAIIIARVNWAFFDKAEQYRYSLEHLIVEGPEREAIPAERTLMAFERDIAGFRKDAVIPPQCLPEAEMPPVITPRPLVRKY
ncbi:MAG: hypothetical protein LDL25_04240 [Hyphomicrobiales bacterium]|uniref:hypothetical protein n=1 Tax=Rhabdaerophilum calidifontis TaxID=2604328 RepID=UPI00123942A6|nr:hypothetical protein [Rhabdaerophilum calidifontis]MCA1998977.1 hypothetical protein [Hyphomicrobiales bacterium]